jgi:hypothetical protein
VSALPAACGGAWTTWAIVARALCNAGTYSDSFEWTSKSAYGRIQTLISDAETKNTRVVRGG